MITKKIVTFTMSLRQSQFEVDRLETEAKKLGLEVNRALYKELSFDLSDGEAKVFVRGEELTAENTMGLWFRVAGTRSGKYTEARNLAIRILEEKGVFCVNSKAYLGWTRMGKVAQHGVFLINNIPIVPTKIFYRKDQILDKLKGGSFFGWEYPVIAKHERGFQGKSVRKFDSWKKVRRWVKKINEKNLGMFLWQKYLPTRWDIRVVVVDGKAIGGMKRSATGEEFRSNFSLGGEVEVWKLDNREIELSEKLAKVCGLDYGGVDIMKDEEGNNYILEINRQCQFQGFEKATEINVARKVVEMILSKN
ncbi:hypothetical protein KKD37_00800 [Patescibacteria group bacterium]|nr:hypothetical protein [Patescibacteria group bacterium]